MKAVFIKRAALGRSGPRQIYHLADVLQWAYGLGPDRNEIGAIVNLYPMTKEGFADIRTCVQGYDIDGNWHCVGFTDAIDHDELTKMAKKLRAVQIEKNRMRNMWAERERIIAAHERGDHSKCAEYLPCRTERATA